MYIFVILNLYNNVTMYKIITISLLITFCFSMGFAQSSGSYDNNKIMLKLKSENRHLMKYNSIDNDDLYGVISQLDNGRLLHIFPNRLPLREQVNSLGDSLVDLGLWFSLQFDENAIGNKIIIQLRSIGIFQFVEYRSVNQLFYVPSDPHIGSQYYLDNIRAYDAWDIEQGDTNVVVAITDTGIDKLQEDLIDGIKYNYNDTIDGVDNDNDGFVDNFCGWDMGSNDNNVQWGNIGHGTFVSGFVSAVPDNNKGIAGVGYHTKILPVRIDNADGSLSADYEGIVYAADHGAAIINCSWGGPYGGNFGKDVVNYATNNQGALIIAACGNSNNPYWFYPASYDNVMSCAATDTFDVRWTASSYGTTVDLSAPGDNVYSTWVSNAYFSSDGTSFSAPIIAGGAALVKAHFPQMNNLQIAEQLRVTADIIDTIASNADVIGMMGAGRMNIFRALTDTLKPSIRYKNQSIVMSNDTISIAGDFMNYLCKSSPALKVKISSPSPYISSILDSLNLGIINTLAHTSNSSNPMKLKVLPGFAIGSYADIKLTYTDTAYSGFEWVRVYLSNQTAILDTNNITTSVNSVSTVGFNDGNKMIGEGFTYKNGRNLLSWGGLIFATTNSNVSDNLYGAGGMESKMKALSVANTVVSAPADQKFLNVYNDDSAGFSKNNFEVNQYSYAFAQDPLRDVVFLEYNIINRNFFAVNNVYVGFYADWDIGLSYKNKSDFDITENLSYTWPTQGGTYVGVQLMSTTTANCYNLDNNGSAGSINIYDGFLNFEKWKALTINRTVAGDTPVGRDVSSMLSGGPYNIAASDTLTITFALLAGDNKNALINTAHQANYWFFNTASVSDAKKELGFSLLQNTPNPASGYTEIAFVLANSNNVTLEIFNIQGKLMETVVSSNLGVGEHKYKVSLKDYSAGIYTYRLSSTKASLSRKLIIK